MKSLRLLSPGLLLIAIAALTTAFTGSDAGHKTASTAWNIDPAHSNISFEVTHFFTPVSGKFEKYSSEIYFDPGNLPESSIDMEIEVNSINTGNQKRDNHLRSDDFFNAAEYPLITFSSDEIVKTGANTFVAKGSLTIKDVTKKIELPFTLLGMKDHPMREGVQVAGIKIDHRVDRTEYKVGVDDWASTAVIGDKVDISIALELNSTQN